MVRRMVRVRISTVGVAAGVAASGRTGAGRAGAEGRATLAAAAPARALTVAREATKGVRNHMLSAWPRVGETPTSRVESFGKALGDRLVVGAVPVAALAASIVI